MSNSELQGSDEDAIRGQDPSMLQHQNSRPKQSQQAAASPIIKTRNDKEWSGEELANYQMHVMLLDHQNKKRFLVAREDQDEASMRPSAATPVPHMNGPHVLEAHQQRALVAQAQNRMRFGATRAKTVEVSGESSATTPVQHGTSSHTLQEYQMELVTEEHQKRGAIEATPGENMEASRRSSNTIPAQHDDDSNRPGAQKRRRGNSDEVRLIQTGGVSSDLASGEPNFHNTINLVQDRVQKVKCDQGDPSSHPVPAFRDAPVLDASWPAKAQGDSSQRSHLNGTAPIFDLETFLNDETSDTAFVVVRTIECSSASISMAHANIPLHSTEKVYAKSRLSKIALQKIATCHFRSESKHERTSHVCPCRDIQSPEPSHPYIEISPLKLFLFHHHSIMKTYIKDHPFARDHISALLRFSEARYGKEFEEADAEFERDRVVSQNHILKLYRPNDLVVGEMHGQPSAFVVHDWPQVDQRKGITLSCWSFQTDGFGFARKPTSLYIPPISTNYKALSTLVAYPLRLASQEIQKTLRESGEKQWSLRKATQVVYNGWNVKGDQDYPGSRFMIDHGTYHKMHEDADTFAFDKLNTVYTFDTMPIYLKPEDSPLQTLLPLLSPTIHGFDLNEKRWVHLRLDSVYPVSWNKEAYNRLVIPAHTKDLLRSLVLARKSQSGVNQGIGAAPKRTDIIAGKGNGLTVLLHGSRGTGKTFTAESLAEMAELPLYRVTCGDIRTDTDAVEKDLAFVLHIGKAWNCVLLLEEADILDRSVPFYHGKESLFSSVLRILEYYDGIVLLTSSRIQIFDDAIISRIQVPLHLKNLNQASRKKIWQMSIDLLEEDKGNANFEEIRLHLDDLAEKELNGHQIRNAFKTAKEVAISQYERLGWFHLVQALSVWSDFTFDFTTRTNDRLLVHSHQPHFPVGGPELPRS